MIDALRQYADCRPSGDDWLGKVPGHWRSISLGAIATRKSTRNRPDLPLLSVLREKGVVLRSSLSQDENHNIIPDDLSNYQVANEGDLVMNKMKAWQGSVGVAPHDGIVSPAYYVFELADIKKKYAHRLLRSRLYADFFGRASDGVRIGQWDLRIPAMKRIPVLIPPPDEQDDIARYLDEMDRRIARFIRNRRRLIEVLDEQKQAIINRAVTRGPDPDASLKPSGVDWMGDIPTAWTVLRAKYLFREVDTRSQDGSETHLSMSQKFGLVPASQLTERHFHSTSYAGGKLVDEGDIVLNRLKAHLGVFRLAEQAGVISPDYTVLRPKHRQSARYFELVLTSSVIRPELRRRVKGLVEGFWRLYTDDFYDIRLPVPPAQEQERVVDSCKAETAELDAAIGTAEREIDLIREYRTRLISDVVTGTMDVRHLAPLPGGEDLEETVEALEPLDDEPGELDEEFMDGEVSHADD